MQLDKDLCMKFPAVLRDKLLNGELELPDAAMVDYERIRTYRAVERKIDDYHKITIEDFRSYFELGKKPKKIPRGMNTDFTKDPQYYGVSSFMEKEIVELIMKFPSPKKKMAQGYGYKEGGPQYTNVDKLHVCWWLYEGADVSGFELVEE